MRRGVGVVVIVLGLTAAFLVLSSLIPSLHSIVEARSTYYGAQCAGCHVTTPTTCNGCHAHGVAASNGGDLNLAGATNKASYAPGEQVSVTVTGGYRTGWVRVILYDQGMRELARSGSAGGEGGGPGYPVTLSAPAPSTPGSFTWNVAWYGNQSDGTQVGPRWTPDANNPGHGREIVATNAFTVTAPAAPAIALNPASLSFGQVTVGSTVTLTTQVRNTGTAALSVTGITRPAATSGEYTFSPAGPLTVAAGGSATLSVTYRPTDAGTDTGSLTIASNASTSPTSLQLTGSGTVPPPPAVPAITLSLGSLDFGTVAVGGVPAVRTTQVRNTGTADLRVTAIARCSGTGTEYTFSPAPPITVPAAASAPLSVTYTPTNAGTDAGCLTIASNDPAHPSVSLNLTGTGMVPPPAPVANIRLNPTSLDFGTVTVGDAPAQLTAAIQNTGTGDLTVTGISRCSGTSAEYSWSPGTPVTVAPGASRALTLTYTPRDAGADAGCLALASNDPDSPSVNLALAGTGSVPPPPPTPVPDIDVTPAALDFGSVVLGGSTAKIVRVTNVGTGPLTVTGIAVCAGTSPEYAWSPDAPFSLEAGANREISVTYAPLTAAADTGCLEIASNDPASGFIRVTLTGAGVQPPPASVADIRVTPTRLDFGSLAVGQSLSRNVTIANAGTATLSVTGIGRCTGTSAEYGWSPAAPFTVAPGASRAVTITYQPSGAGTDSGCLQVRSNDPDAAVTQVTVAGSGGAVPPDPPGDGYDVTIRRFDATEKVDLSRQQQVRFRLAVQNRGTVSGSGPATLVGRQKGAEIYRRTVTLSIPAGSSKTVAFPSFTPRVKGDIAWTVTVSDRDGRPDTARDKTEVKAGDHDEDEEEDDEDD
jgi:hypothetical protein